MKSLCVYKVQLTTRIGLIKSGNKLNEAEKYMYRIATANLQHDNLSRRITLKKKGQSLHNRVTKPHWVIIYYNKCRHFQPSSALLCLSKDQEEISVVISCLNLQPVTNHKSSGEIKGVVEMWYRELPCNFTTLS